MIVLFNGRFVSVENEKQKEKLLIFTELQNSFPNRVKDETDSLNRYRFCIKDMENRIPMLKIYYEGDNYAFNEAFERLDKQRSFYHEGAIDAAGRLNEMCDTLHIRHLFEQKISDAKGERENIGEEIISFSKLLSQVSTND